MPNLYDDERNEEKDNNINDNADNKDNKETHPKLYNDVFQIMIKNHPNDIIPLVNKLFETNYESDAKIEYLHRDIDTYNKNLNDKTPGIKLICNNRKLFPDVVLKINNEIYHIECESKLNPAIYNRIEKYNITISKELQEKVSSSVIFLSNHRNIEDIPNPNNYAHLEVSKESIKKLAEDELYIVLPFAIMRYKYALTNDIKRESLIKKIKNFDNDFYKLIDELYNNNEINKEKAYDIKSLYNEIKRHFNDLKSKKTGKSEEDLMINHLTQTIRETSRDEGIQIGRDEGIRIGEDKGKVEMIRNLMETSNQPFEEVCKMLKIENKDIPRYKALL